MLAACCLLSPLVMIEYARTYKPYFLKRYHNNKIFTWIMLAIRKCWLWLTCLLRINIDLVDTANLNDIQQWISFKFEVPTVRSNAFDWIYFVCIFICYDQSWFLHKHWGNSVIAHWLKEFLKILMRKRLLHKPSRSTRKPKLIARCLGYTVIGVSDNAVFHCNHSRYKCTKVNKAFLKANSHTHTCTYTGRQLCGFPVRVCPFCCVWTVPILSTISSQSIP